MTAEERKRQLALLSQLDGTASLDAAEPPGGALPMEQAQQVPTSARQPLAMPAQRGDVLADHSAMPEQPPVDYELQDAHNADIDAHNDRATEMALRQIVGGITRTGVPGAVSQLGTAEKDLVGQRRQMQLDALRKLEAENNGARTAAYNKQLEAGAERDRASGARADAKLALDTEEAGRRDARAKAELVVKNADLERKKAADALKAKKGQGTPAAADEVPFGDAVFQYQGDPNISKELKLASAKTVREKAGQWNTTMAGLTQLEKALGDFVRSPTPQNKSLLYGPALAAAGATNAALGQGAMSQDEKAAQFQALGVNMGDAAGIQALVERAFSDPKATEDVLRRVRQMKGLALSSVTAAAQPHSYKVKGAAAGGPPPPGGKVVVSNGKETLEIDAEDVAAAEKDGFKRVTK